MEIDKKFFDPENFENREVSWLRFDLRVLNEARDKSIPVLERLKFISITSSNLDEFFMVRVASLKDMIDTGYKKKDLSGLTAQEQLSRVIEDARNLVDVQYSTYNRSILPLLEEEGIVILSDNSTLSKAQKDYINHYFDKQVYPVLTPMAVDASRPFPLIANKSLNIGAILSGDKKKDKEVFATVQVPKVLPRLVEIPSPDKKKIFVFLENIIQDNLNKLFLNNEVLASSTYRIMRNADMSIDEEEAEDLLLEIQKQLKQRQRGEAIRLEVSKGIDKRILKYLSAALEVEKTDIFSIDGPIDLTCMMSICGIDGRDDLRNPSYSAAPHPSLDLSLNIFDQIKKGDIFLHHPYISFDPVVAMIQQAAVDPNVLAIKQTLYRVSSTSPIIAALEKAAENGKQVSVLVELKARFDEENNIEWAKKLEKAGCHVIYGLVGLKTHSKIALVVRKDEEGIVRYVHLGTGNYNDKTAKLYTDCGILTCREAIGVDATAFFNMLSGYSEPPAWNRLVVAPIWLRKTFLKLIEREKEYAKAGKKAHIIAKMNSLCDQEIIAALYEASSCGVKIELLVRGICCLKVGIPGVSDNISVRSIVGNFLEHSRIFYFYNDGAEEYYMGSADWMPRNLDRRVEIIFPVEDEAIKAEIKHILDVEFADNVKAHILQADGSYKKADRRGKVAVDSQLQFCNEAHMDTKKMEASPRKRRLFIPAKAPKNV